MVTALAAAIRERARLAWQEVQACRQGDDAHALMVAEAEWEDAQRLARVHAVPIEAGCEDDGRASGPGKAAR
ncbi:hypothetical protein [Nonomuraea roseoviolacea]|uniref:Uncharacterized protein n=1 Tax=Nonomuraea roseoviolacea subsp. carminata TaxID=160689 RepID=A0ABT1KBG5_9ACTN|nr:hypothetical protein [Nonomuraea roseoviolacea]MCP2351353.1 hypothetical protein [Nonomuraea roseoviolacea subsp. carminata]